MSSLVKEWFEKWETGDFKNFPITENFSHTSPFGEIKGKDSYLALVSKNKDKFLGYSFEIHDSISNENYACVRYTAKQGQDFSLDVSEWYYFKENQIDKVIAYYHIGEIREDRTLNSQ